ncbi:MAG: TetR/AcrR family transcriptional regulator [Gammaproteobacteria bacterium]|nr:TetR/AcrR family transcriptional regulator [Gammaproteobacteria bacterium]
MRFRTAKLARSRYEGTKQAEAILRAARAVFVRDGATGFSARRVAREAGLSLGSVQHVFPTADGLLVAMFEHATNSYDTRYLAMSHRLPLNARARWRTVVDVLVDDVFDAETRRFFFGFWALGCHNRLIAALLKEGYAHHTANLAGCIAALRPELDDAQCHAKACQVAALIEGWMVYTPPGLAPGTRSALRRTLTAGIEALLAAPRRTQTQRPARPRR